MCPPISISYESPYILFPAFPAYTLFPILILSLHPANFQDRSNVELIPLTILHELQYNFVRNYGMLIRNLERESTNKFD